MPLCAGIGDQDPFSYKMGEQFPGKDVPGKSVCGDSYRLSDGERVLRDGSGILYIAGYSDSPVSGIHRAGRSRHRSDGKRSGQIRRQDRRTSEQPV